MNEHTEPTGLGGEGAIQALTRMLDRMKQWQKTPEGMLAIARHEQDQLRKQRDARQELCDLRGIPEDLEVRRWALNPNPEGDLFDAARETMRWQIKRERELGGDVPALRFLLGNPGTGKTSALAWAVASWHHPARYWTADVLCRSKNESLWMDATNTPLLALDELGVEPTADRITELLLQRWSKGKVTLCGSNLTAKGLIERYMMDAGARLVDRLVHQRANGLAGQIRSERPSYRGAITTRPEDF